MIAIRASRKRSGLAAGESGSLTAVASAGRRGPHRREHTGRAIVMTSCLNKDHPRPSAWTTARIHFQGAASNGRTPVACNLTAVAQKSLRITPSLSHSTVGGRVRIWFLPLEGAEAKIDAWRTDYNERRHHGALRNAAPRFIALTC